MCLSVDTSETIESSEDFIDASSLCCASSFPGESIVENTLF